MPLVLTPVESGLLDQGSKAYGRDGRRRSPHSCLQEWLNADDSSEWGVLCNGSTLRLLHDNPSLVKPAYVEIDLSAIFGGGLYEEFAVLWVLLHCPDAIDQPMLAAARLAMDLALPTEEAGPHALLDPQRCVHWLRRLYEKAIGGFYRFHLHQSEWVVSTGRPLSWPLQDPTSGIARVFPSMRTDIVIDRRDRPQRLVIDTKFTHVFGRGWYREQTLRAGHVYQLYAYLRSQEGREDPGAAWAAAADGLLLHPAIGVAVDESVSIQGHRLRFATVDLAASHGEIHSRLLALIPQS